jgi:hypothetical protein
MRSLRIAFDRAPRVNPEQLTAQSLPDDAQSRNRHEAHLIPLSRLALVIGLFAFLTAPQTAAARALTAPRYHDQRPAGCLRTSLGTLSVRDCDYPDGSVGMWTDQDEAAVLVAYDDGDGDGLTLADDRLCLLGLD